MAVALGVLGGLAALAVATAELPPGVAVPVGLAAIVLGLRQAGAELRRPVSRLVIPHGPGPATVDSVAVHDLCVRWRGPLAFVRWRDASGRLHRLHGLPDNLHPAARRELRLAMRARDPAPSPRSMAP